jgi:membrane protease YdiL (CAAX protease family)
MVTAGEISDRLDADAGVRGGKGRIRLKIGLFYVLAVLLTLPLEVLNHHAQGYALQVLVTGVMWCPALAAVMTILVFRDDISALGLRWCSWRYIRWALIIPVLYVLPAYLAVWVLGLGGFYNADFAATVTRDYGFAGAPAAVGLIGYVLLTMTAGVIIAIARALGEELGWRGFLVPQLAKLYGFAGVGLISGLLSANADGRVRLGRHTRVVQADLLHRDDDGDCLHRRMVAAALGKRVARGPIARRAQYDRADHIHASHDEHRAHRLVYRRIRGGPRGHDPDRCGHRLAEAGRASRAVMDG